MSEPLVFTASYESLARALGPKLDPSAKAKFRAHGVDFDRPLQSAYPLTTWVQSLEVACELLLPGRPRDEQTYLVGRRIVLGFAETMVGKALFALLRIQGPHRGLMRMARNLRMSNNYSESSLEKTGVGYRLWVNKVNFPHYYRGVFEAGLESVGAKDIAVKLLQHDAAGASFDITFR